MSNFGLVVHNLRSVGSDIKKKIKNETQSTIQRNKMTLSRAKIYIQLLSLNFAIFSQT